MTTEHSANRYTKDHRQCAECRELKRLYQLDYRAQVRKARADRRATR